MKCFPIYIKKISSKTFDENNAKVHKQLHDIKFARWVYVEELGKGMLNVELIKDFSGGSKIGGNEVLYGTTEDIQLMAKLMIISNNYPTFNNDKGFKRRGILVEMVNQFISEKKYNSIKDKKGKFIKNKNLKEMFDDPS